MSSPASQHLRSQTSLHPAQLAYDELAAMVMTLARTQGFSGSDPLSAVEHLRTPTGALLRLGRLTAELWVAFFGGFRPDEQQFEQQAFLEKAQALQQSVAALQQGAVPDVALCEGILATLGEYWQQRQAELHQRIDLLIQEVRDGQQAHQQVALSEAHQSDELTRLLAVLNPVALEMGISTKDETPPAQLLIAILQRIREELRQQSGLVHHEREWRKQWGAGIAAVIADAEISDQGLREDDVVLLQEIQSVFRSQANSARQLQKAHAQLAQLQQQARAAIQQEQQKVEQIREELATAQTQLARYEQAVRDLRAGTAVSPALQELAVHAPLQQLDAEQQQRLWRSLDALREQFVVALEQLYAAQPLGEDPRILRPRRLRGNAFAFKTLQGQTAAMAAAAGMVVPYLQEMATQRGAPTLGKDLAALRPALNEVIALISDWRSKLGKAPPLSLSLPASGDDAQLLLTLAADIETLLNTRGAASAAKELRDISDQICDLVANAFARIDAESGLPERSGKGAAKKRCLEDAEFLAAAGERAAGIARAAAQSGALAGYEVPLKQVLSGLQHAGLALHEAGADEPPTVPEMTNVQWSELIAVAQDYQRYLGSVS